MAPVANVVTGNTDGNGSAGPLMSTGAEMASDPATARHTASTDAGASDTEDFAQLDRDGRVELCVRARLGVAVGAPAREPRGVPEAIALQVLVSDLGDELDAQRLPREVLPRVPPAQRARAPLPARARIGVGLRPLAPRVIVERAVAVRRELFRELLAQRR